MNCQEVMELMQRHLDGDLNHSEDEALKKHLQQCPECAEMFARLQKLSQELASLPKVTPPFSLVDAILPKLDEIDRGASAAALSESAGQAPGGTVVSMTERRKRSAWPLAAVGGVVAAGILLVVAFVNGNHDGSKLADDSRLLIAEIAGKAELPSSAGGTAGVTERRFGIANQNSAETSEKMKAGSGASSIQVPPAANPEAGSDPNASVSSASTRQADARSGSIEGTSADPSLKRTDIAEPVGPAAPQALQGQGASGYNPADTPPAAGNAAGSAEGTGMESVDQSAQQEGITSVAPLAAKMVSEDGSMVAVLDDDRRQVIIRTVGEQPAELYVSEPWGEQEKAELGFWAGTKFSYTVQLQDGSAKTYTVNTADQSVTVEP
jgi:hypothetical protein